MRGEGKGESTSNVLLKSPAYWCVVLFYFILFYFVLLDSVVCFSVLLCMYLFFWRRWGHSLSNERGYFSFICEVN